jgi:hypothetical protein
MTISKEEILCLTYCYGWLSRRRGLFLDGLFAGFMPDFNCLHQNRGRKGYDKTLLRKQRRRKKKFCLKQKINSFENEINRNGRTEREEASFRGWNAGF